MCHQRLRGSHLGSFRCGWLLALHCVLMTLWAAGCSLTRFALAAVSSEFHFHLDCILQWQRFLEGYFLERLLTQPWPGGLHERLVKMRLSQCSFHGGTFVARPLGKAPYAKANDRRIGSSVRKGAAFQMPLKCQYSQQAGHWLSSTLRITISNCITEKLCTAEDP